MADILTLQATLAKMRADVSRLEADALSAREQELMALPKQVGLATIDELIKALAEYASPRMKGRLNGVASRKVSRPAVVSKKVKGKGRKKRTRATITDELRDKVIADAKAGKMTGVEIAKAHGISVPSVANIKKAAGLTKKRGKK